MKLPIHISGNKTVQNFSDFEEKELLFLLKSGDVRAFEEIYTRYKVRLAGKFIHLLKSEELAQDALQDLFSKIWEVRETIDPEQSFVAFLYRIATNLAHNVFRRAAREGNVMDKLKAGYRETYNHIEESVIRKENIDLVRQALKQLPERQREVYILHKIEGKSYKEISEQLQISLSAINNHITRANHQLIKILGSKAWFVILLSITSIDYSDFF